MRQFETTLGLTSERGAIAIPISFSIEPRRAHVSPAKNSKLYTVSVHSYRHSTDTLKRFKTSRGASEYIELMNSTPHFLARLVR